MTDAVANVHRLQQEVNLYFIKTYVISCISLPNIKNFGLKKTSRHAWSGHSYEIDLFLIADLTACNFTPKYDLQGHIYTSSPLGQLSCGTTLLLQLAG